MGMIREGGHLQNVVCWLNNIAARKVNLNSVIISSSVVTCGGPI